MRGSIANIPSRRPIPSLSFVVGKDSQGRWTALGVNGLAGGVFRSKDAALRYAQAETGRSRGAVRLTSAPLELSLNQGRLGHGEGLPAWWRFGPGTRGTSSFADHLPIAGGIDRRWLMIDLRHRLGFGGLRGRDRGDAVMTRIEPGPCPAPSRRGPAAR